MRFKKIIGVLHLWLGLLSGIVIIIIAVTGALWAFETEIQDAIYSYRKVKPHIIAYQPPSVLRKVVQEKFGDKPVKSIVYVASNRSAMVRTWGLQENGEEYNLIAFVNPYTAELLYMKEKPNFFDIVIELHTSLMLGDVGRQIIDFSTLVFLVMIVSGIILWWPSKRNRIKSSFKIKWGASFKRMNYDLHNVAGFYAAWILIFIVLTGLAWGFDWFNKSIYYVSSGGAFYKDWPEPSSISDTTTVIQSINIDDKCFNTAISTNRNSYESAEVFYPQDKNGSLAISLNPSTKTYYKSTTYFFDQRTAQQVLESNYALQNGGEKLRSMYYDIHIGKILGFPGQLFVFLASLIAASLPVTGFLIWRGKNVKKKNVVVTTITPVLNTE